MITLIIDKCIQLNHHANFRRNNRYHVKNGQIGGSSRDCICDEQTLISKLMTRFKVTAEETEPKTTSDAKPANCGQTDGLEIVDPTELTSKEYYQKMTSMNIWESLKHLWNRKIDPTDPTYQEQFLKAGETGGDRVRLMWTEYWSGEDNPETTFIASAAMMAFCAGFLYGGIVSNQTALFDFVRRHNEFVFRGDIEGKRKIRDTMHIQFVRKGWKWAWRMGLFTGALTGGITMAIAYRNEVYVSDCMISGALVCSLWKSKLGFRAMAVSGVLGSIFGAIFGGTVKLMLWTLNTTVPEYRHWRHVRYRGYLEPQKYSDGSTEYNWQEGKDPKKQPDYPSETQALRRDG